MDQQLAARKSGHACPFGHVVYLDVLADDPHLQVTVAFAHRAVVGQSSNPLVSYLAVLGPARTPERSVNHGQVRSTPLYVCVSLRPRRPCVPGQARSGRAHPYLPQL